MYINEGDYMSKDNAVGLTLQDAFAEAEAEVDVSASNSEAPDSAQAEPVDESQEEQPNVESQKDHRLFSDLEDETNGQNEQSQYAADSMLVKLEDGTEVSVSDLKAGSMMKADYTRKTQELSELRAEAQDAITLRKALQENPQATVRRLWEAVSKGETPLPKQENSPRGFPEKEDATDIDALVQRKLEEALANDPRIQELEAERSMQRLNVEFAKIEKDWGIEPLSDDDKHTVLVEAQKTQNPDLEAVFAKMMHKRELKLKERQNVEANSTVSGFGGEVSIGVAPASPKTFKTFRDAMNDTLSEESVDAGSLERAISNL
jgi:hypothetical protein